MMGQHEELELYLTSFISIPILQSHWEVSSPAHSIRGSHTSKGTERTWGKVQTTSILVWTSVKCVLRNGQWGWRRWDRWEGLLYRAGAEGVPVKGFKHGTVSSHGQMYVLNLASVRRKGGGWKLVGKKTIQEASARLRALPRQLSGMAIFNSFNFIPFNVLYVPTVWSPRLRTIWGRRGQLLHPKTKLPLQNQNLGLNNLHCLL